MHARHKWNVLLMLLSLLSAIAATGRSGETKKSASPSSQFPELAESSQPAKKRELGTAITWERSIRSAADKARGQGKLVFVIHVSGDFEQPEFT